MCKEMEVFISGLIWFFVVLAMLFPGSSNAQTKVPTTPTYDTPYGLSGGPKSQGIKLPSC